MELLHPAHPPHHNPNPKSHSSGLVVGPDRMLSSDQLLDIVEEVSNERVYVAVGNSLEKALSLLNWVFSIFGTRQICLLHVHRPSPLIPTPCKFSLLLFFFWSVYCTPILKCLSSSISIFFFSSILVLCWVILRKFLESKMGFFFIL